MKTRIALRNLNHPPSAGTYRAALSLGAGLIVFYPIGPNGQPLDEDDPLVQMTLGRVPRGLQWKLPAKDAERAEFFASLGVLKKRFVDRETLGDDPYNAMSPWERVKWDQRFSPPTAAVHRFKSFADVPEKILEYDVVGTLIAESVDVSIREKTVDLDASWRKNMTRRPGGGPNSDSNKMYVMPSGDVSFAGKQTDLQKVLRHLLKVDRRVTPDFAVVGNERFRGKTIADVVGEARDVDVALGVGGTLAPVVAYHGTSKKRWAEIKSKGLVPNMQGTVYEDLIPGYSDFNVYLALDPSKAENYATRQAIWDKSAAVVLKVVVRDVTKVMADEDEVGVFPLSRDYDVTYKARGRDGKGVPGHYPKGQWTSIQTLMDGEGRFVHDADYAAFREEGLAQIRQSLKKSLAAGTFAYRGRIPAKDVSFFMEYKRQAYPPEKSLTFETYQQVRKEVQEKAKRAARRRTATNNPPPWADVVDHARAVQDTLKTLGRWAQYTEDQAREAFRKGGRDADRLEGLVARDPQAGSVGPVSPIGAWVIANWDNAQRQGLAELYGNFADLADQVRMQALGWRGVDASRPLTAWLEDARELYDRYASEIGGLLAQAAPESMTYQGLAIRNPLRFRETYLKRVLGAVDRLVALFKRRGVLPALFQSVKMVVLQVGDDWAGRYEPLNQVVLVDPLSTGRGRMLDEWVHEILVHEVGHHIYHHTLHPEAVAVWEAAWEEVEVAKKKVERILGVTGDDRLRFWGLLERSGYDVPGTGRRLKGLDRLKYLLWLSSTSNRVISSATRARLTDYGKRLVEFFRDPTGIVRQSYTVQDGYTDEEVARLVDRQVRAYRSNLNLTPDMLPFTEPAITGPQADEIRAQDRSIDEALDKLGLPTNYARTNEREDFAESFVQFLNHPEALSETARGRMEKALSISRLMGAKVAHREAAVKVLYHASKVSGLTHFDPNRSGLGTHFGTTYASKARARDWRLVHGTPMTLYRCRVDVGNPLRMADIGSWDDEPTIEHRLFRLGLLDALELQEGRSLSGRDFWAWVRSRLEDQGFPTAV